MSCCLPRQTLPPTTPPSYEGGSDDGHDEGSPFFQVGDCAGGGNVRYGENEGGICVEPAALLTMITAGMDAQPQDALQEAEDQQLHDQQQQQQQPIKAESPDLQ